MNLASTVSLVAATNALVFALVSLRLSFAPGWRHMRAFAAVCVAASAYCASDMFCALPVSDATLRLTMQVNTCAGGLLGASWVRWFGEWEQRPPSRARALVQWAGVGVAALALVPHALITDQILELRVDWLGVVYRTPQPSALGVAAFGYLFVTTGWTSLSSPRWREGWGQRLPAMLTLLLVVLGVHDTIVSALGAPFPLLADPGLLVITVGFGLIQLRRFIADATRLEQLSTQLEQQVKERTDALADAQSALARAEKLAAVGQLAAGVAHEVNNPATVVLANLQYLREAFGEGAPLDQDALACLDDAREGIERISRIVKQLLHAGRVAGHPSLHARRVTVAPIVADALARVAAATPELHVTSDVEADLVALADPDLVAQVLVNLVTNASHALEGSGVAPRVSVRARRSGASVEIAVRDNGPGVPDEARGRIFEPFFTTKPQGRGSGLGLAVSLGIMRAHGGDLVLADATPGATFVASLPAAEEPDSVTTSAAEVVPSSRRRVLVVDDEEAVRESLRRSLSKDYDVEVAGTVDEALSIATRGALDAVVCDVVMPDGGGPRFDRELAARAPALRGRVLYLTGGAATDEARAFTETEGRHVLLKPIDRRALARSIEALAG